MLRTLISFLFYSHSFIVVCAKTIANGLPMAAIITTREIAEAMNVALPFNTYSSNPIACTAGITSLEVRESQY